LYSTFRILNFADMTVEGTFPLGAAVAVANISHGMSPYLATFLALLAGMAAGLVTGLLYTKGIIPILLAGILTMTAIYSINLRILCCINISLICKKIVVMNEFLEYLLQYFNNVVLGIVIVVVISGILIFFINTDFGHGFIATGDNQSMANSLGIYTDVLVI